MSIRNLKNQQAEDYIRHCLMNLNAGEALPPCAESAAAFLQADGKMYPRA